MFVLGWSVDRDPSCLSKHQMCASVKNAFRTAQLRTRQNLALVAKC